MYNQVGRSAYWEILTLVSVLLGYIKQTADGLEFELYLGERMDEVSL